MALAPSYKQSEAGLIPDDWTVSKLGDLADFANGKPYEGFVDPGGRYSLITLDSIGIDGNLKSEHRRVDFLDGSLRRDDIVVILSDLAHGNLLGLCDLIPYDDGYVLNQRVGRLRVFRNIDPQYVRLQINFRQEFFKRRGQGTSQKHIYKRDIFDLSLPVPELDEQRLIATTLTDMDALINALEELIAKKRAIKQGVMQ